MINVTLILPPDRLRCLGEEFMRLAQDPRLKHAVVYVTSSEVVIRPTVNELKIVIDRESE